MSARCLGCHPSCSYVRALEAGQSIARKCASPPAYLALFAIPLVARHRLPERPSFWLQAAAVVGFIVTLMDAMGSTAPSPWKPMVIVCGIGLTSVSGRSQFCHVLVTHWPIGPVIRCVFSGNVLIP
jgi:hypothetical protein